jgi:hypothetical protein
MERMLFEWRWDKSLASTFNKMIGKISSSLGVFLNVLLGIYHCVFSATLLAWLEQYGRCGNFA